MTDMTRAPDRATVVAGAAERKAQRAARIRGVILAALGLVALGLVARSPDTPATFTFWVDRQGGSSVALSTTVGLLWILTGAMTGLSGVLQLGRGSSFRWRRVLLVVVPLWTIAAVAALLAGRPANLTATLGGTLSVAAQISLGAFAGIVSERSGISDIAIEGKFLIGACVASVSASAAMLALGTGADPTIGVLIGVAAAGVSGALVSLLLGWLGIRWKVDQIIAGVVINIGALGITGFIYQRILASNKQFNTPPTVQGLRIPVLSELPVIGPVLFTGTPYLYATLAVMVVLTYMLFRTRWGLRLRASGEKPSAAGTVGIDVVRIRYRAMLIAGVLAGIGGSSLSLASAGSFQMNASAGRGFIALAAVIFGAWNPVYAFGAALVFGFADSAQSVLSIMGADVPTPLLNSVPYLVTIVVVAGVVGRVRGPAAAGQPYDQG
jgi:general nucleoside transport system permease protein